MKPVLRVGGIAYLNALPLVAPLENQPPYPVEIRWGVPSQLVDWLLRGEVDVAIASSIACLRDERLDFVPGIGIASRGAVRSIKVFSRVPPHQMRTLALDQSSLTSNALVRILLRERYGVDPETVMLPPDLPRMLHRADAAVLIGDVGLMSDGSLARVNIVWQMDPGEEWFRWTGLPFVFALWTYRRGHFRPEWETVLQWAKQEGERRRNALARRVARERGLSEKLCVEYLRDVIYYDLGEEEERSLERFRTLAVRHGFL